MPIHNVLQGIACLTLVTFFVPSAGAGVMANGGGSGKGKVPMSSCIRIVDKKVGSSGTVDVQYFVALFTLKNVCPSGTYNVTFDVPFGRDPKCQRIAPGKTRDFVWQYSPNATFAYRRIKECT